MNDEAPISRWPSAEAFYDERDDRTNRSALVFREYSARPVEVVIPSPWCKTLTGQRIALVAVNLAAKWARRVHLRVQGHPPLARDLAHFGPSGFIARALDEMRRSDPFGTFTAGEHPLSDTGVLRCIVAPDSSRDTAGDVGGVAAWASGWRALLSDVGTLVPDVGRSATRAAAGIAAALAVGQLFKVAIGQPSSSWITPVAWNLWSHELRYDAAPGEPVVDDADRIDVGRTLLGGVGAIGSAFVYLISLGPVTGTLGLLDGDFVDVSNLNRSPIFTVAHALAGISKVEAAATFLKPASIQIERYAGWWNDVHPSVKRERWDCWISLTNERGVWSELPFHDPPTLLHATTTSGWGFGVGRHGSGDDCTRCRMPQERKAFRGPCAVGALPRPRSAEEPPRAALPFLSVAAAALLVGEFDRLRCGVATTDSPNQISADLLHGLSSPIAVARTRTEGCQGCDYLKRQANTLARGTPRFPQPQS